jgi:hypothetical protein
MHEMNEKATLKKNSYSLHIKFNLLMTEMTDVEPYILAAQADEYNNLTNRSTRCKRVDNH